MQHEKKKCLCDSTPKYRVDPKPQNTVCCLEGGQNNNPDSLLFSPSEKVQAHTHTRTQHGVTTPADEPNTDAGL